MKVKELVSGFEFEVEKENLVFVNLDQYKYDNPAMSDYTVIDYNEYFVSGEYKLCGYRETPYILSDDVLYQCEIIE